MNPQSYLLGRLRITKSIIKDSNIILSITNSSDPNDYQRYLTVTPESTATGTAKITVTVTDSIHNLTDSNSFVVTIRPARNHVFKNAGAITINDNKAATPYPSYIQATNLLGTITNISVTLYGVQHTYPTDIGVLLVSPDSNCIVLMNKAGGNSSTPATNVDLTFNTTSLNVVPASSVLTNGSYLVRDYRGLDYSFTTTGAADLPPAGPYANTGLDSMFGHIGSGQWKLYVQDFSDGDSGMINGGWSLDIETAPSLVGLTNVTMNMNDVAANAFVVYDDATTVKSNRVTLVSSSTSVIPNNGLVVVSDSKSPTNFSLTITPAKNMAGTNIVISVFVTNADNQTVSNGFLVTVVGKPFAPTLTITNTALYVAPLNSATNTIGYTNINFDVTKLQVTASSSDESVLPTSNIKVDGSNIIVKPIVLGSASCTVFVTVSQPANLGGLTSDTKSFKVIVSPGAVPLFVSTNSITINDRILHASTSAAATPYPASNLVSGLVGNINHLTVTLLGLQHSYVSDVSILLVGPNNAGVVLMRTAGSGSPSTLTNLQLTFDDAALSAIPNNVALTSGTYSPGDYNTKGSFVADGTNSLTGPYGTSLSVFSNTVPNGVWKLYVQDDANGDHGLITGGWALSITTDQPMFGNTNVFANVVIPENGRTNIDFTVSSTVTSAANLSVSASVVSSSVMGLFSSATLVSGINSTNSAMRWITLAPQANMPSLVSTSDATALISVVITDNSTTNKNSVTNQFPVTVKYENQPPVASGLLSSISTAANVAITNTFTVSDVESSIVTVTNTWANQDLGTVSITPVGNGQQLVFQPAGVSRCCYI